MVSLQPLTESNRAEVEAAQEPAGFVMINDDVDGPEYFPQYLWKLSIDERYGFGRTGEIVFNSEVLLRLWSPQ